jgi:hypothetical protein
MIMMVVVVMMMMMMKEIRSSRYGRTEEGHLIQKEREPEKYFYRLSLQPRLP